MPYIFASWRLGIFSCAKNTRLLNFYFLYNFFIIFVATYGVSSKEQKKIVKEFVKHTFKANIEQVQVIILSLFFLMILLFFLIACS